MSKNEIDDGIQIDLTHTMIRLKNRTRMDVCTDHHLIKQQKRKGQSLRRFEDRSKQPNSECLLNGITENVQKEKSK